jgi:hypothetical protein
MILFIQDLLNDVTNKEIPPLLFEIFTSFYKDEKIL